jgi:hypothetical protein
VTAVSRLENIETVMLDILVTEPSDEDSTYPRLSSDYNYEECLKVASTFMASCPTLRRFSFGAPVNSNNGEPRRIYPCYVRSSGGKVQLEGFDLIDKDSWRRGI